LAIIEDSPAFDGFELVLFWKTGTQKFPFKALH
jgi:hypothetical protein